MSYSAGSNVEALPSVFLVCPGCGRCEYSRFTVSMKNGRIVNENIGVECERCGSRPQRQIAIPPGYLYVHSENADNPAYNISMNKEENFPEGTGPCPKGQLGDEGSHGFAGLIVDEGLYLILCPECDGRGSWQDQYEDGEWARSVSECQTCEGEGELTREDYISAKTRAIRALGEAMRRHKKDLEEFLRG